MDERAAGEAGGVLGDEEPLRRGRVFFRCGVRAGDGAWRGATTSGREANGRDHCGEEAEVGSRNRHGRQGCGG